MRTIAVFILGLFLAASDVSAATYYVATTGQDAGPGSLAAPWATLQNAVESIQPGDTVLVQPGTYAGFRIENSGRSGALKTIRAVSALSVVVNRPGPKNRHSSNIEIESFGGTIGFWVIAGFDSMSSPRYGIDLRDTTNVQVRNCRARSSRYTGIFTAFSDHVLIANNESLSNGEHGIYHSNSGDYPIIRANHSHHNYAAGIHMNGDYSMGGDGQISFALVEQNVIWENGTGGGSAINCDGVEDSLFRNNLIYNNHASGISLYVGDGARASSRNKVYNNTIVMAADGRWVINIPKAPAGVSDPVDNRVYNNILYTPHVWRGSISTYGPTPAGFESDYNVVVNSFSIDDGANRIFLAQWQSLGHDRHSIIATPAQLFANPAAFNFRLKSGSPAINTGMSLDLDVPYDFLGQKRPKLGAYDIGAYESKTP